LSYCFRYHRQLHSFPTRRSSDLNMTRDYNKGISQITYNHLNLPKEILFSGTPTRKILYLYDALCQKVQKKVINGSEITTTDYLGDRKSTRLNSSHVKISYAVFCL